MITTTRRRKKKKRKAARPSINRYHDHTCGPSCDHDHPTTNEGRRRRRKGPTPLQLDPTRSTQLRKRFMADMGARFRRLRGAVRQLIEVEDVFGLKQPDDGTFRELLQNQTRKPDTNRPQAHKRGYGWKWRRARAKFLAANKHCKHCSTKKKPIAATRVDHIKPVKGPDDPLFWKRSNWQALCETCHNRKTASGDRNNGRALAANELTLTMNTQWAFLTDAQKVKAFQQWLVPQINAGILEAPNGVDPDQPWTSDYVESAYMKGINRAWQDTHQEAIAAGVPPEIFEGGAKSFINDAFGGNVATGKIELLATRSFEQLKGVTAAMGQELNRILSAGIANGSSASTLAKQINDSISGITKKRAMTIARTEIIHAHAEGQLDAFEKMNIKEVGVLAEWKTAGDGKVCPLCNALNGAILTVKEARGILPRHPNCRCAWLPAGIGEPTTGQKWAKDIIDEQMLDSMKLETGEKTGKGARAKSKWLGASKKIGNKSHLKPTKANLEKAKAKLAAAQKKQAELAAKELAEAKAKQKAAELAAKKKQEEAAKAAAEAKAKAKALHSEKVKAGVAKKKLKTNYGLTEDDFFVPKDGGVASISISGWQKIHAKELGLTKSLSESGLLDNHDEWLSIIKGSATPGAPDGGAAHHELARYQAKLTKLKAKKAYAEKHGLWKDGAVEFGTFDSDGFLTEKGVKAAFADVGLAPTPGEVTKIVDNKHSFFSQKAGVEKLRIDLKAKAKEAAAKKAAAAAEHSKKVKAGMAKAHLKKKHGLTDGDFNPETGKLKNSGVAKIAAAHGMDIGDLPDELFAPSDIVGQKDVIAKLKKPKGTPKPPSTPPAATTTTGPAQTTSLPKPADLTHVKQLPGSTRPTLQRDKDGKQWVMKTTEGTNLKPAHIRSEAMADDLYRRAGLRVPAGGIVDTPEGPVKITEFLEGGQTLADWKKGKTAKQIREMHDQISEGFVADALFANHDVAGLGNDNIFIVNGKPIRIDNGGALTFRAQGGKKQGWGPVVKELDSLRDKSLNPNTAAIFKDLTDAKINSQIEDIVGRRDEILAGIKDKNLRNTVAARMDYLEARLPKTKRPKKRGRAGKLAPAYEVDDAVAADVRASRLNGRTIAGDRDMIEDNNILAWQEEDVNGEPVTKVHLKVTPTGSKAIERTLGSEMTKAKATSPTGMATSNVHPDDDHWDSILAAAKTVNHHASDGAYNASTLATMDATKKKIAQQLKTATGEKKKMLTHYRDAIDEIEKAKKKGATTGKLGQYVYTPPKRKAAASAERPPYKVRRGSLEWQTKDHRNGRGRVSKTGGVNKFGGDGYIVDVEDDDVTVNFLPNDGGTGRKSGRAFHGTVELTVKGEATPENIRKALGTVDALGVPTKPPTPEYEELLYLHRTVYQRNDHGLSAYKTIMDDDSLDDAAKVAKIKTWAAKQYDVDFDELQKSGRYNPAGRAKTSFGDGTRYWERWDLPPDEIARQMKGYTLTHNSYNLEGALEGMLQTGGETTTTVGRVRKGVNVSSTGGTSSSADVETGGASYFFTRIHKGKGRKGSITFKIDRLGRQDAITYDGDKYGRISALNTRKATIEGYRQAAGRGGNETIFKEGLSLIDDVEHIHSENAAQRKRIIKMFKDNKLAVLPDGRKIEDVVK